MPFDDDDDDDDDNAPTPALLSKSGLKLSNQKSMFAKKVKKPSQQAFEAGLKQSLDRNKDYKERAAELAIAFRKMLDDKTVPQNKNIYSTEIERETLGKMAQLGIDMNLDDQEEEGMGSVGLITLLFRCLLIQRDKINGLDYAVNQMQSQLKILQLSLVDKKDGNE